MNYTGAKLQLAENNVDANLAPRQQLCGSNIYFTIPTSQNKQSLSTCIGAIDTAQEKLIGIGTDYPFNSLGAGECLLPIGMQTEGVAINDSVEVYLTVGNLLNAMAAEYNKLTEASAKDYAPIVPKLTQVTFNCKVVGFLDGAYGKYGKDDGDDT